MSKKQIDRKVDEFKSLVANGKDFIKNEEKLTAQEKELLQMSFDTMIDIINHHKKD